MKTLDICKDFFVFLNSCDIRYCHWKSNTHLDKALSGKTDLDILIHADDREQFEQVCEKFNIKHILSPPEKQFPGIEDYLGFDYKTGRLIHLHIHYSLILGQKYIKNHHLPIEDIIFQNLTFKNGVAIPCPELELMLLIIRAHMKIDSISLLKHAIRDLQGRFYSPFPGAIEKEMSELIGNCDMEKFKGILSECNLPIPPTLFVDFISKFSGKRYKCFNIFMTERKIISSLKIFRRQTGVFVLFKYLYLSLLNNRGVSKFVIQKKKTVVGNGKIFSLVGADGSGKSSLISDLEKWLSWKLSVKRYYYGIPKTNFIIIIDYAIRAARKFKVNYLATFIESCLWSFIAILRYKVFLSSNKDTSYGNVVLTDRFPLEDFQSMVNPMDGPRLRQCNTKIGRYFSQIESNFYDRIKHPDCIFVLQVDIDELRKRKTNLSISTHKIKANAVNAIKGNDHIALIDANKTYSDVQLELKRKIWEFL
ncbi:MAG: hypothetical protein ACFFDN_26190 [Candidatus Hodarchaeota archaeon]